jgi:hypothetical protein
MPTLPFGEWRPDVADYQQEHSKILTNVVPRGDGYGPVKALQAYSDALAATCRGIFLATNTDGSIAVFAGTATALYKMDNTDLSWENVTRASGGAYNLASSDQWQFAQFGTVVIAVNQNDAPQAYTLGSSTDFAALAGSPPQAAYVTVVSNHLVLSGLLNNADGIAWSGLNDVTSWVAGVDGSDTQDFWDGGLVKSVAGGEHGVVFQTQAIRRMTYVGGETIFEFERIVDGEGLAAPYSVINAGARIFFLGTSGFQMIVSGQYPVPISKERFYRTFQDDWDEGSPQLMIGANEALTSRVWWFYKSSAGAAGLFNRAICYDWALERPTYVTGVSGEYVAEVAQPGVTLDGLEALGFTNIDTMTISFDDFAAAGAILLGIVDSAHKVAFLTGSNLEATLETPDYAFDSRFFVRAQRPVTDSATVYGSMTLRPRLADAPTYSDESAMNSIGHCPHRADTRMSRFRLRIPAGTTWTYAQGTEPEATTTGKQ